METKTNKKNLILGITLVVSLIVAAFSLTYAYMSAPVTGTFTETSIKTGDFSFTTNVSDRTIISNKNLSLIDETEIASKAEKIDFTVKATSANSSAGRFDVYLKDVAISNNLIDSIGSFRWQLLREGTIIEQGSFNDIETVGVGDTSKTNTATTKYYSRYDIKTGLTFDSTNTSNLTFRIYLLNSETVDQTNLTNGTFQAKLAVEGYNVNNNS